MPDPANKTPEAQVPSPSLLQTYEFIDPSLPALILKEWSNRHARAYRYAMTSLIIGGVLAFSLVGGFVFLVTYGHPRAAAGLLSGGAFAVVTGFVATRLDKS